MAGIASLIQAGLMIVGCYALYKVGSKKFRIWLKSIVREEVEISNSNKDKE